MQRAHITDSPDILHDILGDYPDSDDDSSMTVNIVGRDDLQSSTASWGDALDGSAGSNLSCSSSPSPLAVQPPVQGDSLTGIGHDMQGPCMSSEERPDAPMNEEAYHAADSFTDSICHDDRDSYSPRNRSRSPRTASCSPRESFGSSRARSRSPRERPRSPVDRHSESRNGDYHQDRRSYNDHNRRMPDHHYQRYSNRSPDRIYDSGRRYTAPHGDVDRYYGPGKYRRGFDDGRRAHAPYGSSDRRRTPPRSPEESRRQSTYNEERNNRYNSYPVHNNHPQAALIDNQYVAQNMGISTSETDLGHFTTPPTVQEQPPSTTPVSALLPPTSLPSPRSHERSEDPLLSTFIPQYPTHELQRQQEKVPPAMASMVFKSRFAVRTDPPPVAPTKIAITTAMPHHRPRGASRGGRGRGVRDHGRRVEFK